MKLVNKQVKEARKKAGLTQVELSENIGISRSYLAGVEAGRYNPSVKVLIAIAEACHVDLNFLAGMTEIHGVNG